MRIWNIEVTIDYHARLIDNQIVVQTAECLRFLRIENNVRSIDFDKQRYDQACNLLSLHYWEWLQVGNWR